MEVIFQGNAEKSMMIMVGDVLKKTSAVFGDAMWDVEDFGRSMYARYFFFSYSLFISLIFPAGGLQLVAQYRN